MNSRNKADNKPFQSTHLAMMFKYSGISFISGAINHGFFSGQRSLITAVIGVILFAVGAVMEHRLNGADTGDSLLKTLLLGALLSIGLGFFTGGLQHFPDSPARSSWVVPLGFVVSVLALAASLGQRWTKALSLYAAISSVVVASASFGAWQYFEKHDAAMGQAGSHTDHHAGGHASAHTPSTAAVGNASTQAYRAANDAMHKGMDIAFTGDSDADFLAGMVPHHQGAIDMAKVVLAHGKDPKIRALAQQIITAQEKEIADMTAWQSKTGAAPAPAPAPSKAKHKDDHSGHKH